MEPHSLHQLAQFAGGTLARGDGARVITRISTDSRTIEAGDFFVPIRGENFDGHRFVRQTAERGAAGALVEQGWQGEVPAGFALIRVADTLVGYQQIAAGYRQSLRLKVIGITGSNGKTSTKDFVASALGRRFRVTKTQGNLNNHVGLPRTILSASAQDEIGVWEMGMNHPGEIEMLARIAAPDAAIVTNIGTAHIEFMGSRAAIAQEKGMLAEAVGAGGTVVLNADDPFSEAIARRTHANVILAGVENGMLRAEEVRQSAEGSEFTAVQGAHHCRVQLPVPGVHMVQNAMLAIAVARVFGLSLEECAAGLAATPLTKARLQMRQFRGVQFLDDSYNANPDSMKAALHTLVELATDGQRIAVLGAMGELGAESERGHREVGESAAELRIDRLIVIGEVAATIADAAKAAGLQNVSTVANAREAAEQLLEVTATGDLVLVKGSRAARTEQVMEEFESLRPAEVGR